MATYRVKAFFMHESERDAAERAEQAKVITEAEWTDGYVIGVIDEKQVAGLVKGGTGGYADREDRERPGPIGHARRQFGHGTHRSRDHVVPGPETFIAGKSPAHKILSQDRNNSQFYVVRFTGH